MKVTSKIYNYSDNLEIDFVPNLAFLFFEGDNKKIMDACYKELLNINPNMEIVGVNGKRGNLNNNIPFIVTKEQISLMLFEVDDFFVKVFDVNDFQILRNDFVKNYNSFEKSAAILFFPFEYDTNHFLDYIQDEKNMYNIYGGVYTTSDNIGCFYNGEYYSDKLISVFFNQEKIEFFSKAIHGWKPIGISFKVTKSHKNIVYEIDNQPALKLIEEHIGVIKQENIDNFLHPFCVRHKDEISLASIKSVNREDNSIEFFKYIYDNEEIKISIPINQHNMMNLIEKELQDIDCDGLFMFSCVGRYAYYKDLLEFEVSKVSEYLNVSFAGFLTFGEIGSNTIKTKSILQNQTMNLIFFRNKI